MPLICPATGSRASAQPVSITFCGGRSAIRPATAPASVPPWRATLPVRVLAHTRSRGRCEPSVTWWFARAGMGCCGSGDAGEGPDRPPGPPWAPGPPRGRRGGRHRPQRGRYSPGLPRPVSRALGGPVHPGHLAGRAVRPEQQREVRGGRRARQRRRCDAPGYLSGDPAAEFLPRHRRGLPEPGPGRCARWQPSRRAMRTVPATPPTRPASAASRPAPRW